MTEAPGPELSRVVCERCGRTGIMQSVPPASPRDARSLVKLVGLDPHGCTGCARLVDENLVRQPWAEEPFWREVRVVPRRLCANCQVDRTDEPPSRIASPCPTCGSFYTLLAPVQVERKVPVLEERRVRHKHGSKWVYQMTHGHREQSDGVVAEYSQLIDKELDRYAERVVLADGTVKHEADERLTDHRGHGTPPKPKSAER